MTLPVIYPGTHVVTHAGMLPRCMMSANVLVGRVSDFDANDWIMDSGAFTRISRGLDHLPLDEYAALANRFAACGRLQAVVTQDFMCEPMVLAVTGGTVAEHQSATTDRYLALRSLVKPYLMPVVQGWTPDQYADHARQLAPSVQPGAWVGVGSVCKRQGRPDSLAAILEAIHDVEPTWRLHGFGVKITALRSRRCAERLHSVDSMAWSFAARWAKYHGRGIERPHAPDPNSIDACRAWLAQVEATVPDDGVQQSFPLGV